MDAAEDHHARRAATSGEPDFLRSALEPFARSLQEVSRYLHGRAESRFHLASEGRVSGESFARLCAVARFSRADLRAGLPRLDFGGRVAGRSRLLQVLGALADHDEFYSRTDSRNRARASEGIER